MKIICLSKYGNKGASSRYRFYNFAELINKKNNFYKIEPLLNNKYLENLYGNRKINLFNIIYCYLKRFYVLFFLHKYDKIIIEKEIFPYVPFIEYIIFKIYKSKIYLDYDDYVFDNYNFKLYFLNYLFKYKFQFILKNSNSIIVGNSYLKKYVIKYNQNVKILPTLVNVQKYNQESTNKFKTISIIWIGTPSTVKYLQNIMPFLNILREKINFDLVVIGAKLKTNNSFVKYFDWKESTEIKILKSCHIGVMPLDNTTWSKGKCGLKILQYMAARLPVVASCIGANKDIVRHEFDGYLVDENKEWIEYLVKLITNHDLRKQLGNRGYEKIIDKYSYESNLNKYLKIIEK